MAELPPEQNALKVFHWKRWLLGAFAIGALYAGLWWLPHHQLEVAKQSSHDCVKAIEDGGPGDPHACTPSPWLAKLLPWTSTDAKHIGSKNAIERLALELAASRDLDRAARDRAAQAVMAGDDEPDVMWWFGGAFDALTSHARQLHDGIALHRALTAALWTSNIAALHELVDLDTNEPSAKFAIERAKLACLLGGNTAHAIEQAHIAVDKDAEHTFGRAGEEKVTQIAAFDHKRVDRIAALCDPKQPVPTEKRMTAIRWLQTIAGRSPQPASVTEPRANRWESVATIETMQLTTDSDPTDYQIELYGPDLWSTPWEILTDAPPGELTAASPTADDATARHLVALADAAKGAAAKKLRANALDLALRGAGGWLRRGDVTHARASLAVASAAAHHADLHDREAWNRHAVIPYLHLAGDLDAALAEQAAAPHRIYTDGKPAPEDELEYALLLVSAGKLEEAFKALEPIAGSDPHRRSSEIVDVAWLRAALAVRLHHDVAALMPAYDDSDSDTHVTYYYRGALSPPDKQAALRAKRLPRTPYSTAVLPAKLYLIGQLAGKGDVELWLDYVAADQDDQGPDPRLYAAARAEAARWRGDSAAVKQWDDRLAALRALVKDDRTDYLLHTLLGDAD